MCNNHNTKASHENKLSDQDSKATSLSLQTNIIIKITYIR